jgi:hypothetical protein
MKSLGRIRKIHDEKGFLKAEDLGMSIVGNFVLWSLWKLGKIHRFSTVIDGTRVVCFHDKSTLLGHGNYPNAHVETRYSTSKEKYRQKIWGE